MAWRGKARHGGARHGGAGRGTARLGMARQGKAREFDMKTVITSIEGVSPYSQSRSYDVEKLQGEGPDDYEKRTWRNRLHVDAKGEVFIPPMAYKNALADAARFLSIGIPGKGKSTYTKHFEAGILAFEPANLGIKAEDVKCERLFVPADGRPGGGKRVHKYFPVIPEGWRAEFSFLVLDETVLQSSIEGDLTVFEHVLRRTGQFIGIGRFRPKNRGFYGRFAVKDFAVIDG